MGNGALTTLHSNNKEQVSMGVQEILIEQNTNDTTAPQKQIAESIRIEGAVGIFAKHINSCFVQSGEMYNDHMLYQSSSNPDHWLWFTTTGRWMVSTTKDRDLNFYFSNGFCHCKDFGLLDPSHAKGWLVLGREGKFRRQKQVIARKTDVELKLQDLQLSSAEHNSTDGETQSTQDALPSVVNFQGATGLSASKINGVYRCRTKKHPTKRGEIVEDKKIFYRHQSQSDDSILLNDSSGRWMVFRDNQVLAYCEFSGLADPCDAKRWCISNASKSLPSFSVQLTVDVKRGDVKDLQSIPVRTKPSFRSSAFVSSPRMNSILVDTYSDKNDIKNAYRKRLTSSVEDPIKKKITPYVMIALKNMKRRNRKNKIHVIQ